MIETMYIGSGDISALLSSKKSLANIGLLQRFVSGVKPIYNSLNSPIDALRTGSILEDRYLLTLPDDYFIQYEVFSSKMDVFKATLDFARINGNKVVDFDELKTINLSDFLNFMPYKHDNNLLVEYIKKNYKLYYNQVQEQLFCTELSNANLVFLSVDSYDDEFNKKRVIKENEIIKVRISRDEDVIGAIIGRGSLFQKIKDYYNDI